MAVLNVSVRWASSKYDVQLDTSASTSAFKSQLFSLTGVAPERQKLLLRGSQIKDDDSWDNLKGLKEGVQFMMMGTAGELPKAPETQVVFMEDMTDGELAKAMNAPTGLVNLGNTCYMNSTLQCLRAMPELHQSLQRLPLDFTQDQNHNIAVSLSHLYNNLEKSNDNAVQPFVFLTNFRSAYPQFAEQDQRTGSFAQQDAEECWNQLITTLRSQLKVANQSTMDTPTTTNKNNNFVDQYMGIEFHNIMKCDEAPDELTSDTKDTQLKLTCHITTDINYLHQSIAESLSQKVEKTSPTLGCVATYTVSSKISRLPAHLTIHFVRFYWRADINKRTKIRRTVQFQSTLDMFAYCDETLQEKMKPAREHLKQLEEAKLTAKREKAKLTTSQNTTSEPIPDDTNLKVDELSKVDLKNIIHPDLLADPGCNPTGQYELAAVLTHIGQSSDSGHYIAWARKSGSDQWYKYDDDKVSQVKEEEVLKNNGSSGT